MTDQPIRFEDGAAYERMGGTWSRIAGDIFIDWLKPGSGLQWIDIDIKKKELMVNRAVVEGKMKGTKTASSNNTIELLPMALDALKDQQKISRPQWKHCLTPCCLLKSG